MKKQLATILRHSEQAERQAAPTPGGSSVREQPNKSERFTSDDTGGPLTEGTANNDIDSGVGGLIDVPIRHEAAGALKCHPWMWGRFSYEKTAKTSRFRDLLVYNFVSLSVPAPHTHGDFVEQIAKAAHIPIDSLPVLDRGVFSRAQVAFGFAGDLFDKVARDFDDLKWWVSDVGLRMDVVKPANQDPPTFDELMGVSPALALIEAPKRRRARKSDPVVARIKKKVRELRAANFDYESICERLGSFDRPPHAGWRDLPWNIAYRKNTSAVTKWLSEACSDPEN